MMKGLEEGFEYLHKKSQTDRDGAKGDQIGERIKG